MNKLLMMFIGVGFVLVGCSKPITTDDIKASEHFCKTRGGIDRIVFSEFLGEKLVSCKSGEVVNPKEYFTANWEELTKSEE